MPIVYRPSVIPSAKIPSKESADNQESTNTPNPQLKGFGNRLTESRQSIPYPGQVAFFGYIAKHKNVLPYYDLFPLVVCLDQAVDGFIGLNLHYLPPKLRAVFFEHLKMYREQRFTSIGRRTVQVRYRKLKQHRELRPYVASIKRYLTKFVKTNYFIVPPEQWNKALSLPLSRFSGSSPIEVWKDSIRMIEQ